MAITEVYVNPAIAGNSGTGTIGDPYGDLQYALDTKVRDATNGDRFNIKSGTDEILAAALSLTTYGTPTQFAPLVLQGYTSSANDGGIGGISGNGSYSMFASTTLDYIYLIDLHLHNSGSANIVQLDDNCKVIRCHVNNTSGFGIALDLGADVIGCYIHDIGSAASKSIIAVGERSFVGFNYIVDDDGSANTSIIVLSNLGVAIGNIIKITSTSVSTNVTAIGSSVGDDMRIIGNTIWGDGRIAYGISCGGLSYGSIVANNIVEGLSGSGGVGYNLSFGAMMVGNAAYNNATNYAANVWGLSENNDTLSGSPFVDPTNGDFDINGTIANVTEDAWPQSWPELTTNTTPKPDKGAVQAGAGAGAAGGGPVFGGMVVR